MSLSGTENEHKGNGRTSEMKDIGQQVYAEADCMDNCTVDFLRI